MKKIILIAGGLSISALVYLGLNKSTPTTPEEDEKVIEFYRQLISQSYPHFYLVSDITAQCIYKLRKDYDSRLSVFGNEIESLFKKKQLMVLKQLDLKLEDVLRIKNNSKN